MQIELSVSDTDLIKQFDVMNFHKTNRIINYKK